MTLYETRPGPESPLFRHAPLSEPVPKRVLWDPSEDPFGTRFWTSSGPDSPLFPIARCQKPVPELVSEPSSEAFP